MPDVVLRALYLYSLYLYIICRAPFLGLPHQQVTSEKEREADRERQRNSYTNRQRKKVEPDDRQLIKYSQYAHEDSGERQRQFDRILN